MVMLVKTVTALMWNGSSACLLYGLFLTSNLNICDGVLVKNAKNPTDESATSPETTTPQGRVRGINMVTHHKRTISGFIGIPYAQPPVGDLRFKAPLPPDAWSGTLDASKETEACLQFNYYGAVVGNEDCLYLNVFTPQLPTGKNSTLLPVMAFVIGGGFKAEDNSLSRFGPDYLLDKDVVLVVPNFRVGVLGHLSTGDEVSPGNYGLKDMVQALKWIQDNIQYFGGDPNQVTLFGGSSGSMSVHLLALSDLTEGLFNRYITQSGTALASMLQVPRDVYANRAIQLGEYLGCPTNSSILLVDCLREADASQLVDTYTLFYVWNDVPNVIWIPTSEPDIVGAFLTDTPANLFAAGKIRDLPWISSVTRDEGLMVSLSYYEDPDLFEDFLDNIDFVLPLLIGYESVVDNVTAYTAALKAHYLNDLSANRSLLLKNFTELMGDASFIYPAYSAFQQQLRVAKSPQYFCSFEYTGTTSHTYLYSGGSTEYTAAPHGDEMIYLFKNMDGRFGPLDSESTAADLEMVDQMVQLWTSFAINGTPTPLDQNNVIWEPYSSLNNYLRIGNGFDTTLEMRNDLYIERMQFWDELTAASTANIKNSSQGLSYYSLFLVTFICLISNWFHNVFRQISDC